VSSLLSSVEACTFRATHGTRISSTTNSAFSAAVQIPLSTIGFLHNYYHQLPLHLHSGGAQFDLGEAPRTDRSSYECQEQTRTVSGLGHAVA
jgi:hypothetical protein